MDTYANILYKLGRIDGAIKLEACNQIKKKV